MVQGENGLHYQADFDLRDFKKGANEMLRLFNEIETAGNRAFSAGGPSGQGSGFAQAQLKRQSLSRATRLELEKLKIQEQELINQNVRSGAATVELTNKILANRLAQQELTAARRSAKQAETAAAGSYREATNRLKALGDQIRNVSGGLNAQGPVQQARIREYARLNAQLTQFDRNLGVHGRNVGNYGGTLASAGAQLRTLAAGYLGFTAALAAGRKVITANSEISDSLSDVQRTAGLTSNEVDRLSESLKKIDSRTGLKGLTDIATIGGQLGIAKEELTGFTRAIDVLAVTLSGEISGGAEAVASSLGKINGVFKVQQQEGTDTEESLNKTGSAILALGQAGLATGEFLQDFSLRVAGTAQTAKIALPTVLAYSAVLEESGISAEVAGTAFNKLVSSLASKREDFFKIAQIGDANLTLKDFTNTINTDANKALQQFFAGLNKGGTDLTSFTDLLDTLKIKTGPGKNAIIALAQNQEILNLRISQSTKAYVDGTLATEQFRIKNENLASALSKVGNAILNAFTSSEGSRNIARFLNDLVSGRTEADKLSEAYKSNKKQTEALDTALRPLIAKYDLLTGAGNLNKDKQIELRDVTAQIGALLPGVTTKFDNYGNALDINRSKVELLSKAQKDLLELQNRGAIEAARRQFTEAQQALPIAKKAAIDASKDTKSKTIGSGLMQFKSSSWFTFGDADAEEIEKRVRKANDGITKLSGQAYESAKSVRDLGGVLTKAEKQVLDYYEAVKKPAVIKPVIVKPTTEGEEDETDNTGEGIKKQIKALEGKRKALDITSAAYKNYTAQINKLKDALKSANGGTPTSVKEEETAAKRLQNMRDRLESTSTRYSRSVLPKDEEQAQQFRDELKKMTDDISKFNANPKNKIKISDQESSKLTAPLKAAINDKEIEQKLAKDLEYLDKQKRLYSEFENYRETFGNDAAKNRYENELNIQSTYLKNLEAKKKEITDIAPEKRTGAQMDYLKDINSRTEAEVQAGRDRQAAVLKQAQTLDQQLLARRDEYYRALAALDETATEGNFKVLAEAYQADIEAFTDAAYAKTEVARRMGEEALILTRRQIKDQLKALIEGFKGGDIPAAVQNVIDDLSNRLSIGPDQSNLDSLKQREADVISKIEQESKKAQPQLRALNKELAELRKSIKGLDSDGNGRSNKGLGKFLSDLGDGSKIQGAVTGLGLASDAAFTLSEGLGGVNTSAGYTLDTIGQLAGAAADLGTSIISGDPAKIIGSAIKAVGTLFSIGKKVREMNEAARKEVADFYSNAIAGEREYQDLLKERQLQTIRNNKTAMQGIRDEAALRKSQSAEYSKEAADIMNKLQGQSYIKDETYKHGTWFRKAEVQKSYGSLQGMSFEQLSQLLAQGKLEGETKALVERLTELEAKGYDATQALAELADQANQELTGTTASGIADAIIDGFKQGKRSAADFASTFQDLMTDAMYKALSNDFLDKAIADYYKKFAELSKNGLTDDEIKQLREDWTGILAEGAVRADNIDKVTGGSTAANLGNGQTMAGQIKSISSDEASKLGGLFNGFRLTQMETNGILKPMGTNIAELAKISKDKLDKITKIEQHTLRTANNTDPLKEIRDDIRTMKNKMDDNANALQAKGRG